MIHATLTLLDNSQSQDRPPLYSCAAQYGPDRWVASSRHGASYELCRVLVKAGCPDQPMTVSWNGLTFILPSIHYGATRTLSEGNHSLREIPWKPRPKFF